MIFKTTKQIGIHARTGILHTRAGSVRTPTFMPDGTRGAVKSLTPQQVTETGVEVVLANTYHLHLAPGEEVIKKVGGLHAFANRSGPILTDSGGFQVFSLSEHNKVTEDGVHFKDPKTGSMHFISPESSIQIQLDLGADMIVAFDHLVGLGEHVTPDVVKDAFDRTHRWLDRCVAEFKRLTADMPVGERPLLFGVVQGGLDVGLRTESLRLVQKSDVDGIAIGGLSVGETREEMRTILEALAPLYDPDRPRFLLGVGTPEDLAIAVENGIDMLDCVLPTRNARHGNVWRTQGTTHSGRGIPSRPQRTQKVRLVDGSHSTSQTASSLVPAISEAKHEVLHLTNEKYKDDATVIEEGCDCYTCAQGFTKAFLRHQFKVGEPLAGTLASIHNLRYMMRLCGSYQLEGGQ